MYSRQLEGVELPTRTAIGRDPQTGQFLTHEFKEYPEGFCRALAEAVLDMIGANGQLFTSVSRAF